jgi:hypothetical protein
MTVPAADPAPHFGSYADSSDPTGDTSKGSAEGLAVGTSEAQVAADGQPDDGMAWAGQSPMPPPGASPNPAQVSQTTTGTVQLTGAAPASRTPATAPRVNVRTNVNFGTVIGQVIQAAERLHRGEPLPNDWIDEQLAGYVPPRNEDIAAEILDNRHVLVLVAGAVGSGRWTTALRLLRQIHGGELTIRPVRREAGDDFIMEGLRGQERTGWILDLRAAGENLPAGAMFGRELTSTRILTDANSYLVVLTGSELWDQIGEGAGTAAIALQPPEASDIVVSYLRHCAAFPNPGDWTEDHRIKPHLVRLSPGQARAWALTIEQTEIDYRPSAVSGILPAETFTKKVQAVISAQSGWFKELAEWHSRDERTSFERNYLLTVAVFDGVFPGRPVDDVHEKVTSLAGALGEPIAPPRGQQGPGLIELAQQSGAELQPNGTVRFPGPGFAEAVVDYFWRDRPHLLDRFTKWTVDQCLRLEQPYQSGLANRVIPWVLHHSQSARSTPFLRSVAARWSEDPRLLGHAVDLLVAACLDPQIGSLTRNAVAGWIGQVRTAPAFKCALAQVFQGVAFAYPTSMLRRLAELAESPEPAVGEAVGAAITALWEDSELRPRLHEALRAWSESSKPTVRRAAGNAFLHLAVNTDETGLPALLAFDHETPVWVIDCWRHVLEEADPSVLTFNVGRIWLDASTASSEAQDQIADALVRAVHDTATDDCRSRRLLNLIRIAENWRSFGRALDEQSRNEVRAALVDRATQAIPRVSIGESTGGA